MSERFGRLPDTPGVWLQDPDQRPDRSRWSRLVDRANGWVLARVPGRRWVQDQFHRWYYGAERQTWRNTYWRGVPVAKCPTDLWVYQELLVRLRPDLIVETGTFSGGSALFFGDVLDLVDGGEVVSIDLDDRTTYPSHPRVSYLTGSSTAPDVVERVRALAAGRSTVLVVLDSDHRAAHVAAELDAYADLVTVGSYLVVEDTNVNGNPVVPSFGPGPAEAVADFLRRRSDFEVDADCERFGLTFNPGGWLRRVR